jgi:hypothetical protein
MKALRSMIAGSVLMSLAACATPVMPPGDASILEVIDRVESSPAPQAHPACAGNTVTYCELDMGVRHCACRNPAEVTRWLERVNGAAL